MENEEFIIAMTGLILGIIFLIAVPVTIYLIVRNVLNNRHKERLAMIEKGFIMSQKPDNVASQTFVQNENLGAEQSAQQANHTAVPPIYRSQKPKAEDSTVKWMFILGGIAVGLLISSIVTEILYRYTLLDTDGIGFSIVVVCACLSLYIYYRRKSKREIKEYQQEYIQKNNPEETKEKYTEE